MREARKLQILAVQLRAHPSIDRYLDSLTRGFEPRAHALRAYRAGPGRLARLPGLARADSYWSRWIRAPLAVRSQAADVFHVLDDVGQVARWLPKERTVVTCHDLVLLHVANGSVAYDGPRWYLDRFRLTVAGYRKLARVVCPSQAVRSDLIEMVGVDPDRVSAIPHGVDPHFAPLSADEIRTIRGDLGLADRPTLLHVATRGFYKNVPATLEALSLLRAAGHDAVLVRAGAPLTDGQRFQAERAQVLPAIIDLGGVSEQRLVELYNAADVFVFPSLAEGFGWPVLEAMACGTPVVAADIPVLRELGGSACRFAPPRDAGALASAVASVLEAPALADQLSLAVRRRALQYDWDRALDAYQRVYEDVAGGVAAGPTIT